MTQPINQLVKTLLQKESIEQCTLHEVEEYAAKYPYFGAAQLLLTKKLQADHPERYHEQLQKTFLFFHNPLWVEHLLNEAGTAVVSKNISNEENDVITDQNVLPGVPPLFDEPEEPVQQEEMAEATEIISTETVRELEESGVPPESIDEEPEDEVNSADQDEKEFEIPALKMETIDPSTAEISYEPFHTVDYFASQGIKINEEEKPKDKFGQQLRSFTDWLKTMKRLPVSEITASVGATAEKKVEQMAEMSIAGKEIVTETMAEVWEKQGNAAKAIDIYSKLSLLYPSKSPYFAAKIDELKKTI